MINDIQKADTGNSQWSKRLIYFLYFCDSKDYEYI